MDFIKTKQNCSVLETLETTSQSSSVGGYLSMNPSDEEYHPGKSNRKKKFYKRKTCSIKKRKKWKILQLLLLNTLYKKPSAVLPNSAYLLAWQR